METADREVLQEQTAVPLELHQEETVGQRLRRKAAASRFLRLREQRREVQMGQDLQLREAPRCLVRREETEHS